MNSYTHLLYKSLNIFFTALLFLLLTPHSYAAITTGSASQQQAKTSSISFNHTLASDTDRIVVVGVSLEARGNTGRTTSITYGGVAMHAIPDSFASIKPGNYAISSELFYLLDAELPGSGSRSIQITHDGNNINAGALQLNGVLQGNPEAVVTNAINSPSSISASINTLTANALILDVAGGGHPDDAAQLTANAAQSSFWGTSASSSQGGGSTRQAGAAGSYTQQWDTNGMNRAALSVVAFAPADGGTPVNQPPVLNAIGDQTLQETTTQVISISATDGDGDTLTFSTSALPSFASFLDNGNNTATLTLAPQTGDAGSADITISVTDSNNTPVSEAITVVVTAEPVNQAPVLNPIGNQTLQEGEVQAITLSATDAEGDALSFSSSTLPSFASLTDNGNNTATLTLAPQMGDVGSADITVSVTDSNSAPVSEVVTVTVTSDNGSNLATITLGSSSQQTGGSSAINFSHSLTSATNRMVVVGVSIEANGNLGRTTSITYAGVPMHAIPDSFASIKPGSFAISSELFYLLDTELPASGSQSIQITHDGVNINAGALQLNGVLQSNPEAVVTNAVNSPSSISASINTLTANALILDVTGGGHPDDRAQLTANAPQSSFWGTSASSSQGGGSTRQAGAAGSYTQQWDTNGMNRAALSVVAFAPADGGTPVNQPPVLNAIGDQTLQEATTQVISISATDADGDALTFSTSALPSFASFLDNGNNTATLTLAPQMGDVGSADITVSVTDSNSAPVSEVVTVTVTSDNGPNLATITLGSSSQQTGGSSAINFSHSLTSATNRMVVVGVSIEANGNLGRTTSITYAGVPMHAIPDSFASIKPGSFAISSELFYLLDTELPASGSQSIQITHDGVNINAGALQLNGVLQSNPEAVVTNAVNSPSSISASINTLTANALILDVAGGGHPDDRAQLTANPAQSSFWGTSASSSQGGGSTRQASAAGSYTQQWDTTDMNRAALSVVAFAPAGDGTPVNQAPVLNSIGNQMLQEGDNQVISISATDADGDALTFSTSALPSFASFLDNGDNTATLTLAPQTGDTGSADITVSVTDSNNEPVSEVITVVVNAEPVNQAPVLNPIGNQTLQEGDNQVISISATDTDGDALTFSTSALPSFVSFLDNDDNTATLTLAPQVGDAGSSDITISVTDSNNPAITLTFNVNVSSGSVVQPDASISQINDTGYLSGVDGATGRDVTDNDNTNGIAGFDFTKIAANGSPATSGDWSCIKDNVTGLIWEVKTTDGGLHNNTDAYTWYDTSTTPSGFNQASAATLVHPNGPDDTCAGYDVNIPTTFCNTEAYVARVNNAGWCGASDWRLPTREELRSLVVMDNMTKGDGATHIDTDYFPNTVASYKVDCADIIYNSITGTLQSTPPDQLTDEQVTQIQNVVDDLLINDPDFGAYCQTYTAEVYRSRNATRGRGIGYATADKGSVVQNSLWSIYFDDNEIDHEITFQELKHVRLVRGNKQLDSSTLTSRYTDNNDGTATDSLTGLIWKRCLEGYDYSDNATPADISDDTCTSNGTTTMIWTDALNLAGTSFAGSSSWRVPNLKELASIARYTSSNPAINAEVFPDTSPFFTWSSTKHSASQRTWVVSFANGGDRLSGGQNLRPVRLVRDPD